VHRGRGGNSEVATWVAANFEAQTVGNSTVYKLTTIFPGWDVRSIYPVGFSPQYTNKQNDMQLLAGLRGRISAALGWDVSASYGRNAIDYGLNLPIVASKGDDWAKTGIDRLAKGESDRIALPEYGAPVHITTQKK